MSANNKQIWIHGFDGRMGLEIKKLLDEEAHLAFHGGSNQSSVHCGGQQQAFSEPLLLTSLEQVDLLLEFSVPAGNGALLQHLENSQLTEKAVLIGTTGLDKPTRARWKKLATKQKLKLLFAPNTSLGILLLIQQAKKLASSLDGFDIEITETHHRNKVDAPSGTALFIADHICQAKPKLKVRNGHDGKRQSNEIGIHAIRGGSVFGEHEVRFLGDHEELMISHRAKSRTLFAKGALTLGSWLLNQPAGIYGLMDVDLQDI